METSRTINHSRQRAYLYAFTTMRVKGEVMPRDPVCCMILDEKTSRFKIKYEGETYHFCSVKCKKKFKRNPRRFAE